MTWTKGLARMRPIVATGKSREKTILVGDKPNEGATEFVFANETGPIETGDRVFWCDGDGTHNQYLGRCEESSATGIRVAFPLQEAPAGASSIWRPEAYVAFDWGFAERGGIRPIYDSGVRAAMGRGAVAWPQRCADPYWRLEMRFDPARPGDYGNWIGFLSGSVGGGTDPFSVAFWDPFQKRARVALVLVDMANSSATMLDEALAAFSISLIVQEDDAYGEVSE